MNSEAFMFYTKLPIRIRSAVCTAKLQYASRNFGSAASEYDVVIIGGGPAGYVASIKAAQLGMKAACIEGRGTLGGTCLNVGCIPSKSMLHNSHLYYMAKTEFKKRGIEITGLSVNLPQMIKTKEQSVGMLTAGISGLFKNNKVDWIKGWGKITSGNTVEATDPKNGDCTTLKAKNIIIATGSESSPFPGVEIDEKTIVSSTGALCFNTVPENLLVLGGGVIGLELGSVWSRLGSKVTVVEFLDQIGGSMLDSTISKYLANVLKKQGLNIKTGTKAVAFDKTSDGKVKMITENVKSGAKSEEVTDTLLISVGRRPFTKNLGLENVGIKLNKRGQIDVDDNFVTNVPSIRAIGDVIRGPMLAHKAEEEGLAVIENIHNGGGDINYEAIPSVIYTSPEVAWVGKTEEEVKNSNIEYSVGSFPFLANSRAKTINEADGLVKVVSRKSDDKILGIHIIGSCAGELMGEAVLAIGYGASSEDIARTCHAHPTFSEALKEACMATYDKAIHF